MEGNRKGFFQLLLLIRKTKILGDLEVQCNVILRKNNFF